MESDTAEILPIIDQDDNDDRNSLADASRAIRLESIQKLPTLVDEIADRVERYADDLEKGLGPFEQWVAKFKSSDGAGPPDADDIPF